MEQLIYIDQNDKNEASKLSKGFTVEEVRSRAYVNALGTELATKYLVQENISVNKTFNIHNINKIREEFDIADIMLPNIHIDVRVIYDENLIFIPKSHFDYNIVPDIYLVFKMTEDTTHVGFLGFFEPKLINTNNQNDDYYFIEKEKLSNPIDLKHYIENFNGNTTKTLTEEEHENAQRLALALIDDNISEIDKKNLLSLLTQSATLREELAEFDNFEWISYHTITSGIMEEIDDVDDFKTLENNEIQTVTDEFDMFDNSDDFENFEEEIVNTETPDIVQNQDEEILDNIEELPMEEPEELTLDESFNDPISEELVTLDEDVNEPVVEIENIETFDEPESLITESIENIDDIETVEELSIETPSLEDNSLDNIVEDFSSDLAEDFSLDDGIQTEEDLEVFDNILVDNNIEEESLETFDNQIVTDDLQLEKFEDEPLAETPSMDEDVNFQENSPSLEIESEVKEIEEEKTSVDTETADIIDSLLSDNFIENMPNFDSDSDEELLEEIPEETTSFDGLELPTQEPQNTEESAITEDNTAENDSNSAIETFGFDSLGINTEIDETNFETNESTQESSSSMSFEELGSAYTSNDELAEIYDDSATIESMESLAIDSEIEDGSEEYDEEAFLNSLVEETDTADEIADIEIENIENEDSDQPITNTVFENSTTITNTNITPGEIPIDINQTPEYSEDDEKLEMLYNNEKFNFDTNKPEKGKKAIVAASVIVATLAALLVFGTLNKPNKELAEQPNTFENNVPEALEQNIPQTPEQVIPENIEKVVPKVEDKAKVEKAIKEAKAELTKPKTAPIITPYLEVQKLSWSVPDYLSYSEIFKQYLQTAGKSLKLSLSSDLLLATEYAYSNQISVDISLTKEGTVKEAQIIKSSGSTQIDAIVLRTVKETLNVVKAPAGVIIEDTVNLTLKISL